MLSHAPPSWFPNALSATSYTKARDALHGEDMGHATGRPFAFRDAPNKARFRASTAAGIQDHTEHAPARRRFQRQAAGPARNLPIVERSLNNARRGQCRKLRRIVSERRLQHRRRVPTKGRRRRRVDHRRTLEPERRRDIRNRDASRHGDLANPAALQHLRRGYTPSITHRTSDRMILRKQAGRRQMRRARRNRERLLNSR